MVRIVDLDKARRDRERRNRPARPAGRIRGLLIRILVGIAVVAAIAVAANWRSIWPAAAPASGLVNAYLPAPTARGAAGAPLPSVTIASRRFPICGSGARLNCVVDGDTIWLGGTKIRLADINTPELSSPQCATERRLGEKATVRLQALLEAGPFEVRAGPRDEDRYGRKLRTFHRAGKSLGDVLVAEGLAHPWTGRRESWCG